MVTGRTVGRFFKFQIDDTGGVLRDIPVMTIGEVGLEHPEIDVSALQDAVIGFLLGIPGFGVDFTGPFDNSVAQAASASGAAPALSGSHTVLEGLNGVMSTPLAFGMYIGIRNNWATGDPVFGVTGTAANGGIISNYKVNMEAGTYSAKLAILSGSIAPAWGTAAIT